jgi:hypothetical protein
MGQRVGERIYNLYTQRRFGGPSFLSFGGMGTGYDNHFPYCCTHLVKLFLISCLSVLSYPASSFLLSYSSRGLLV